MGGNELSEVIELETESEMESDLEKTEFCVIDLETTGLNPKKDEILAIALIPMTGMRIHAGKHYYTLIKPKKFRYKSIEFHGICPSDVSPAPAFEEVGKEVLELIEGKVLIGFATLFDIEFLKRSFKEKMKKKFSPERYADIAEIEAWLLRKKGIAITYRLDFDTIMKTYGISETTRHDALSDAYITARIFQKQISRLIDYNATIFDLVRIGRRLFYF
ncbi:MAG: 3'-5' exonuclease [Archaeoglobus sp.]|nr:3'-5' exonuclease [Archaeoglobus sp.]